jgi:Cu/Ag efflux pump CusA
MLKARFALFLPHALNHPAIVTVVSMALLVAAGVAITRMGTAFLPEFHEGSLTVQANTLPGTSLAKSDEIGSRVEQILLAQPEVVATAGPAAPSTTNTSRVLKRQKLMSG